MIEAAAGCEAAIERALAGMPEGGMAEIVGERQRLGQILVETERAGERARDLGDLESVGQPGAKMIPFVEDEDLGLVRESAKRGGVDDAVAVAPEGVAGCVHRFRIEPAATPAGSGCVGRARKGRFEIEHLLEACRIVADGAHGGARQHGSEQRGKGHTHIARDTYLDEAI